MNSSIKRTLIYFILLLCATGIYSWLNADSNEKEYTRTLYLNFRGVTLKNGPWDPVANTAGMPIQKSAPGKAYFPFYSPPCKTDEDCREGKCSIQMPERKAHTYNPFNEPQFKRCSKPDPHHEDLIVYHTKKALQDFAVDVVSERPDHDHYDQVIFNYNSTVGVPDGGSAGLVCNNQRGNMIFFVQDSRWGHAPQYLASIVVHEFGHTLGLGHNVGTPKGPDPMGRDDGTQPRFLNKCVRHDFGPAHCKKHARQWCGPGKQNTYKTAMALLGPRKNPIENPRPNEFPDQVFTEYQGKQDGDKRHMFCKRNAAIVGMKWYRGAIIDRVRGICANDSETADLGAQSGHGPKSFVCTGRGNKIVSVTAWTGGLGGAIDGLQFTCKDGETGGPVGNDKRRLQSPPLSCPDGEDIVGISGNRGGWLNSIALICDS